MTLTRRLDQSQSQNEHLISLPHTLAELPVEACVLFSIIAMAALGHFEAHQPDRSEHKPSLETIWNENRLRLQDLSDPFRMTALLKTELAPVSSAGDVQ